jgi:hypothetical protein
MNQLLSILYFLLMFIGFLGIAFETAAGRSGKSDKENKHVCAIKKLNRRAEPKRERLLSLKAIQG